MPLLLQPLFQDERNLGGAAALVPSRLFIYGPELVLRQAYAEGWHPSALLNDSTVQRTSWSRVWVSIGVLQI